ncbi:MAG: MFS transporter [Chloroflexota bacterium]|nr:MFS transporter [Chloroflexota bacterium]
MSSRRPPAECPAGSPKRDYLEPEDGITDVPKVTPLARLNHRERTQGLLVILVDTFLMWGGFFMVIPLISVHYVNELGWAAASVGLVLAVRQLTQQGLAFIGGVLADRLGAKGLICTGLFVRGIGFVAMAWASTLPLLLLTATLAALGGAMFEAPKAAAIRALTEEAERARFYALSGVVSGLGLTVGPLVGALLLRLDFALVALVAGGCFFVTGLVTLVGLPSVTLATERGSLTHGLRLALRDRPFVTFTVILMGYYFMWAQLVISFPLAATEIAGTPDAVSWVYGLNAGMAIVLQYPLLRLAERWLRPLPILILGIGIMALGLAGVALTSTIAGLLLCVAAFSIGSLLASPSQQTVTASLANPAALGSYFGVGALSIAIGGGLGNYAGGLLYGFGERMEAPALPWLVFSFVGIVAACGMWAMDRQQISRRPRSLTEPVPASRRSAGSR